MDQALAELKERLGKLTDLRRTGTVLVWDMTVFMPPGGGPTRAAQLATLEEITHEHEVDERFGELFEELEPYAASLPHDSDDASPDPRRAARLEQGTPRPDRARGGVRDDRSPVLRGVGEGARGVRLRVLPTVARAHLDLRRRYVECFAPYDDPYDVLLDDYEPGMSTAEIREIFAVLTPELRLARRRARDRREGRLHERAVPRSRARRQLSRELTSASA